VWLGSTHTSGVQSDSLVPVGLGVLVECRDDDGKELLAVVPNQTHYVVIAPVVECTLCNLDQEGWEADDGTRGSGQMTGQEAWRLQYQL